MYAVMAVRHPDVTMGTMQHQISCTEFSFDLLTQSVTPNVRKSLTIAALIFMALIFHKLDSICNFIFTNPPLYNIHEFIFVLIEFDGAWYL